MTSASPNLLDALSPSLFWDVDPTRLEPGRDATFIIARVMDRGTRAEVQQIRAWYGDEALKKNLLRAQSLDSRTLAFFSTQFGISRTRFRAYKKTARSHV